MRQVSCLLLLALMPNWAAAQVPEVAPEFGKFQWVASPPLVAAHDGNGLSWHAIKDPSIVRFQERWHLFATLRGTERSHAIVYISFEDWQAAERAPQTVLPIHSGYYCAPQVFWFAPQARWYLICQASSEEWGDPPYRPAVCTTTGIHDPNSWTQLQPLSATQLGSGKSGLDFWVICDADKAHLFYTTLDGRMWRTDTRLSDFPHAWAVPHVVLQDEIFEASHTYRLRGREQFLRLEDTQSMAGEARAEAGSLNWG